MADSYWMYSDNRQQVPIPSLLAKRSRSDYDVAGGHEMSSYYARDEKSGAHRVIRDTDSINSSYDRFLRSGPLASYGGVESARPMSGGHNVLPVDDYRIMSIGGSDPAVTAKSRTMGLGGGRPELPLPPDASNTLYVEGLPPNCTRREVAHIFRPFVGYKEVRLVTKESKHPRGDPMLLCFVDFVSPAHAATAMDALEDYETTAPRTGEPDALFHEGYKFDDYDRDSVSLRLQFARYPGARSGGGHRGKR